MAGERKRSKVGAGVAGASSGTGLLAFVNSLPDGSHWKPLLTFAAPTISVAVSAVWLFLMARFDAWLGDRTINGELKKARARLNTIEGDPKSSDKLKRDARAKVESLEKLVLDIHTKRVEAVVDA